MKKIETKICLNMIVKNETKVLPRLFASLDGFIDYYVISDTGSTDGTQELIKELGEKYGIPGEINEEPWQNFGYNRNVALTAAVDAKKEGRHFCNWLLFIDADEELGTEDKKWFTKLQKKTSYNIQKHHGNMKYFIPHILNIEEDVWEWRGPAHNYIHHVSGPKMFQNITDPWIIYHAGEGAKSHGHARPEDKYLRDAALFEAELEKNPDDSRSRFYLAQSYRDGGELQKAYDNYSIRANMENTWAEERYVSMIECGKIMEKLKFPADNVIATYIIAYDFRPTRPEAPYLLSEYLRSQKKYHSAYVYAKAVVDMPVSGDLLFVRHDIHDWKGRDSLAVASYWSGHYDECIKQCRYLLKNKNVPASQLDRIKKNIEYAERELAKR